jgi:hypothetical protein
MKHYPFSKVSYFLRMILLGCAVVGLYILVGQTLQPSPPVFIAYHCAFWITALAALPRFNLSPIQLLKLFCGSFSAVAIVLFLWALQALTGV